MEPIHAGLHPLYGLIAPLIDEGYDEILPVKQRTCMNSELENIKIIRTLLWLISCTVIVLASLVYLGWGINNSFLIRVSASYPPMKPNTALMFLLTGISLICVLLSHRIPAVISAGIILLISGLSGLQHLLHTNWRMDRWLIPRDFISPEITIGPTTSNTAFCFFLIGICLILTAMPHRKIYSMFAVIFSCFFGSIASISFFGYLFNLYAIVDWFGVSGMSLLTSIGLLVLSQGIFLSHAFFLYRAEKVIFGPIIGCMFFTLYVTCVLWGSFKANESITINKTTQNSVELIAHSMEILIDNIGQTMRRLVSRWETLHGYSKLLWDVEAKNHVRDINSIDELRWYNKNLDLQWAPQLHEHPDEQQDDSAFMKHIKSMPLEQLQTRIYSLFVDNTLYLFTPSVSNKNTFEGLLRVKINVKALSEDSVPKFLQNYYQITILDQDNIIYTNTTPSAETLNITATAPVTSSIINWIIKISPYADTHLKSFLPKLIVIIGLAITFFIGVVLLLLQKLLQAKEKIAAALSEKASALAYRQAILDSSNYSIIGTDPEGIIVSFNRAAERMLLMKAEDMIHKMTPLAFHDEKEVENKAAMLSAELHEVVLPGFEVFVAKTKRQGIADEGEWTYIRKDGTRFPIRLSVTAVKDSEGKIIGFLGIAYDLTELKKIDQMKNELIAITSHELRSPLTSIKGALELLAESEQFTPDEMPLLRMALTNCERLLKLTRDILDIQKMEAGKMDFVYTKFQLKDLLDKTLLTNQFYAQTHHITLQPPTSIPEIMICGDEDRILQVMTNFISNAIKNSPENTTISFDISVDSEFVHIGVKDQGPGIPHEFQSRIFQKFSQLSSGKNRKEGTGLGLSICKAIISQHNGKIGFDTSPQGTTFWFELPLTSS